MCGDSTSSSNRRSTFCSPGGSNGELSIVSNIIALAPVNPDAYDYIMCGKHLLFLLCFPGPVKNFPRNLCYLTYITTLVIKNNHLERLPPELGNLVNLVNLDASHNRLRGLPATLGDLTDLKALVLNDNQIADLPLEIGRLMNLKHFSEYFPLSNLTEPNQLFIID